tara:strand:- start:1462 stop:1851 length:390 start_codon:yes stop_codon:yes gene_type:complete
MQIFSNLISISIVFVFYFSFFTSPTLAIGNVDWILLKENQDGKEWLDMGSIKKLNSDEISVLTKFYKNPNNEKKDGETSLYVMRINCVKKEFKDISINGIPNFNSKWQTSNNDELIDVIIDKGCLEEGF